MKIAHLLHLQSDGLCIATLVVVFVVYVPLAFVRFAFSDDYAMLMIHGFRQVNPFWIGDGRVLGGILCNVLYSLFDTISAAAVLRSIGLFELLFCLFLIQKAMVLAGVEKGWAAACALLFAASPTIQNWVVWGVSAWQLPALALGIAAYFPWRQFINRQGGVKVKPLVAFIFLQVSAFLIYQPFATAAWPLIMLHVLLFQDDKHRWPRAIVSIAAFALTLVIALGITKLLIVLAIPSSGHNRTAILSIAEIPSRLRWFCAVPLAFVFSYITDAPRDAIYLPALAVIAGAIFVAGRSPERLMWLLAVNLVALLITATSVIAPQEITPVRTYVPLALFACVSLVFGLQTLARFLGKFEAALSVAMGTVLLVLIARSGLHVFEYTAVAQAAELRAVENTLSQSVLPADQPLVLLGAPEGTSLVGNACETVMIGCASSAVRHSLPNMVRLWLRAQGRDTRPKSVFFARARNDALVFSFEPEVSNVVPMPKNPVFVDLTGAPSAAARASR